MDVLLKTNMEKLGRIGDIISVRDGFARNYLLPTGRAALVNKANLDSIEHDRAAALVEEESRVKGYKDLGDLLKQTSVTVEGKANEEGHLFGSVSAAQIGSALRAKGIQIDDKMIRLDAPLKEIGVFDVVIHLHSDVETTTKVWVVQSKPE